MSKRKIPALPEITCPSALAFIAPPKAFERWNATLSSAAPAQANVIEMLDIIGEDFWTGEGVTAKKVQTQLRDIKGDVTVLINSPGGLVTEGNAIYNMLRAHDGEVTVKILGMAASIASVIAMAGDRIEIARSAFLMVHNSSTVATGTRHEMQAAADWLEMVDADMREIYALRTGLADSDLASMMDRETFVRGNDAVEKGFADALLPADQVRADVSARRSALPAAHRIDALLARNGISRADRRKMIGELKTGTQNAAEDATPGAGESTITAMLAGINIT